MVGVNSTLGRANGERRIVIRKSLGISPAPTALGCAKLEEYVGEIGNFDFGVLTTQADFGEISKFREVSVSRQDRVKNRTVAVGCVMRKLKDTLAGYLTGEVNMFSIYENANGWKCRNTWGKLRN